MAQLSVNVNKIALLRNSRGGNEPHLLTVVGHLLSWGARGITVHPRPDGRHILYEDVRQITSFIQEYNDSVHHASDKVVEFNVEGYPSEDFMRLIQETKPHQCTLVPDPPSALTSDQGWNIQKNFDFLKKILETLHQCQIRTSLFIDPLEKINIPLLKRLSPHRVEFYTGAWAKAYDDGKAKDSSIWKKILQTYKKLSEELLKVEVGINAGHDLNQKNLKPLLQNIPLIQEVSIGHAFVCESLYEGLEQTFRSYLNICKETPKESSID